MDKQSVPAWIENTPFKPKDKKPAKITKEQYPCFLYGSGDKLTNNEVLCSTDKITVGIYVVAPGSFCEPAGYHLYGDECYYMLDGEGVAINPESGETFAFKTGDALLIPQKTRHQIFNFENKKMTIIFTVAPRIWVEGEIGVTMPEVKNPRFYTSDYESIRTNRAPIEAYLKKDLVKSIDSIGYWPLPGEELRKLKQLMVIKESEQMPLIHGKKSHILYSFIISNDYMNIAMLSVPASSQSEVEKHKGDKLIHVIDGELNVRIVEEGSNPDDNTVDAYNIYQGQSMLIPEGYSHYFTNFTDLKVRAFIAVGPKL